MILQWATGLAVHWLVEQPGHHGFSKCCMNILSAANNGSDLKVWATIILLNITTGIVFVIESFPSYHWAFSYRRIVKNIFLKVQQL
jgi:K+-transporting ATPase A subunit